MFLPPPAIEMTLPPTIEIDVLASSLCRLDEELSALDLDYSMRSQYLFTVRKFLTQSDQGRTLQQLVDLVGKYSIMCKWKRRKTVVAMLVEELMR